MEHRKVSDISFPPTPELKTFKFCFTIKNLLKLYLSSSSSVPVPNSVVGSSKVGDCTGKQLVHPLQLLDSGGFPFFFFFTCMGQMRRGCGS
jgi:hypothetical protein